MKTIKKAKYPNYDWDKIPIGSTFTAQIKGKLCEGRIFKEFGRIYLCQNKRNGASCSNRLGYKCSWTIGQGKPSDLKDYEINVTYLEVWLPEFDYKIPVPSIDFIGDRKVLITKDVCKVGCTPVSFEQVEAVYKEMLKLRKC